MQMAGIPFDITDWSKVERTEHTVHPRESHASGWLIAQRDSGHDGKDGRCRISVCGWYSKTRWNVWRCDSRTQKVESVNAKGAKQAKRCEGGWERES